MKSGINFAKLLKNYKPGWVAISADHKRVLVWGKSLKETMRKAKKLKEQIYYFPSGRTYGEFIGPH